MTRHPRRLIIAGVVVAGIAIAIYAVRSATSKPLVGDGFSLERIAQQKEPGHWVGCGAFSSDGNRFAYFDRWNLGVWNWRDGSSIHPLIHLPNEDDMIFQVAWSSTEPVLAAIVNSEIQLWDATTKSMRREFKPNRPVYDIAFLGTGMRLVSVEYTSPDSGPGNGGRVHIWNVETGQATLFYDGVLQTHPPLSAWASPYCVAASDDGTVIGIGFGSDVIAGRTEDVSQQHVIERVGGYTERCGIDVSRDGTLLAIGGKGNIGIWDISTGLQVDVLSDPGAHICRVKFLHRDNHPIGIVYFREEGEYAASRNHAIHIAWLRNNKLCLDGIHPLIHTFGRNSFAVSPDNKYIAIPNRKGAAVYRVPAPPVE